MLSVQQYCFIRTKIRQMQNAMLYFADASFFNLHSAFARIIALDEECSLWVTVNKPVSHERLLPIPLEVLVNYYLSDVPFDLDMMGEAILCTDETTVKQFLPNDQNITRNEILLLKLKIIDIDYWEHTMPLVKRIPKQSLTKFQSFDPETSYVTGVPSNKYLHG